MKTCKQLSAEGFFRCGNRNGSCGYLTQLPTQFNAHMREEHANDCDFPCVHCGSVEMTRDSLLQHLEDHLTQQSLLLYCAESTCNFNSSSPDAVLQHIVNSHSTLTRFTCWCCSASFSSIDTFVTHVKQNILQVANCPHCSAKDTDRQRILTHISSSHPGIGRMVRIHKLFLCENRTMSAWHDQNAKLQVYATREYQPLVQNRNLRPETDFIDLTISSDCETPELADSLSEDEIIIDIDTDGCTNHDVLPVQRTAEEMEMSNNDTCRVTAGETCLDKGSERQTIDLKKRKYVTRKSGFNARPQRHRAPNNSNKQIPFSEKIVTEKYFKTVLLRDYEPAYYCILCDYKFLEGSMNDNAIRRRKFQHISKKHKEKPPTGT